MFKISSNRIKKLFVFFAFCTSVLAEETPETLPLSSLEQVAMLSSDSGNLIGGVLSAVSGQLVLQETDLTAHGAQPIPLTRFYAAPQLPERFDEISDVNDLTLVHYLARTYRGWSYFPHHLLKVYDNVLRLSEPNGMTIEFTLDGKMLTPSFGMSNWTGGLPSGALDPHNIRIEIGEGQIRVCAADGTQRLYVPGRTAYLLYKEILPNGKVLLYQHDAQDRLTRIRSTDPQERHLYAQLSFQHLSNGVVCTTHTGERTLYQMGVHSFPMAVKGKKGRYRIEGRVPVYSPHYLIASASPNFYAERLFYDPSLQLLARSSKDLCFGCAYTAFDHVNRISTLSFPVGEEGAMEPVYRLEYLPPIAGSSAGTTTVTDPFGYQTRYTISPELHVTAVENARGARRYEWLPNGWLSAIIEEGQWRRSFEYDAFGNPILETWTGDLTGESTEASYSIRRSYSTDGLHLLLQEEADERPTFTFKYLSGTKLLTEKHQSVDGHPFLSEFYTYDVAYNLVRKELVGSNGERHITEYLLRQEAPHLHLPAWIIESTSEGLLRKTALSYDAKGRVVKEEIYGADGGFAYAIERTLDSQGNVLSETNALGQRSVATYDAHGRCLEKNSFSGELTTHMTYDAQGRLTQRQEVGEGIDQRSSMRYDACDRCIQKRDPYGYTISHAYEVGSQPTRSVGPEGGVTESRYDHTGREFSHTDANGHTTQRRYTAYGQVAEITYPNGSTEQFRYTKGGRLASHTNQEGSTTHYRYDIQGRVIETKGLYTERFTYDALHLVSARDKEGVVTTYAYDAAGRKSEERTLSRSKSYRYDSLGRKACVVENGERFTYYAYDLLDRVVEERIEDGGGNLLAKIGFAYDAAGNRSAITHYLEQEATESFAYDALGREILHTTALGAKTHTQYDGLTETTTAPNGVTTCAVRDGCRRIVSKEERDAKGSLLREERRRYDPVGNLLELREGRVVTRTTYDSGNCITSVTRGAETPEARVTSYERTPSGRVARKRRPSGVAIEYQYDAEGRLLQERASDGSLDHRYRYSPNGHLVEMRNGTHVVHREVDSFGNCLKEEVDGLALAQTFDAFGCKQQIRLPDGSALAYTYDPLHLRSVGRLDAQGTELYRHRYSKYDLSQHPLLEELAIGLGECRYDYDLEGRVSQIESPYFSQQITYDVQGNPTEISSDGAFAYDALSQLVEESGHRYGYDAHANRTKVDGEAFAYTALDEARGSLYDRDGNLLENRGITYRYDALGRLVEAIKEGRRIEYAYDALGRCLSKRTPEGIEYYLYDGREEIGIFDAQGRVKELCVRGLGGRPVAIEKGGVAAVVTDYRGSVRAVVDGKRTMTTRYSAFGGGKLLCSYGYAGKRWDADTGLYCFGYRYYDPLLGRWLTPDPAGFVNGTNLYLYAGNNPLAYMDPDGRFFLAIPLLFFGASAVTLTTGAVVAEVLITSVAITAAVVGGCAAVQWINDIRVRPFQDIRCDEMLYEVYAPDRPLPRKPGDEPMPESDSPHTQLGKRKGRKGEYSQAREFDENGKPVRDIDFTDHGRPSEHSDPHEHKYEENPTGGTRKRSDKSEPVPEWNYEK